MDDIRKDEPKRTLGQITVLPDESPPQLEIAGQPVFNLVSAIYEWTPAPELMDQLPPGFTFQIRCITGNDDNRRFYPVDDFESFISVGFTAGLAVLSVIKGMTPEQLHSYRSMFLLFQRVRRTKEHLRNTMLNETSLRLSRVGRDLADERSILPETVGLDAQGMGRPWSVDRLISEGRKTAREIGIERPNEADCVQYGLVAAATLNPLVIPAENVPDLVRQALYADIRVEAPPDADILQAIIERTLDAVYRHLDEPADEFTKWFMGRNNSFIGQIGRRKRLPGGRIEQSVVRWALLDLGIQAYPYVAGALHAAMRVFQNSIPEPLTDVERTCFEQMHLPQPHFGNLPLVLLVERFPLLKDTIWNLFTTPGDQQVIGVLHRLLDWYGDLARSRRKADRKIKDRRPANRLEGDKSPLTVPFSEEVAAVEDDEVQEPCDDAPAEADDPGETGATGSGGVIPLFEDIAERVCASRQVHCDCGLQNWHHRVVAIDDQTATIEHFCVNCNFAAISTVAIEDIKTDLRADVI